MKRRVLLPLLLLPFARLRAATKLSLAQLAAPAVPSISALVGFVNGTLTALALGPGLTIANGTVSATGTPINFADSEVPGGTLDGANVNFSLAHTPNPPASLRVYRNGLRLAAGSDFTLGTVVTGTGPALPGIVFVAGAQPQAGDILLADYRF